MNIRDIFLLFSFITSFTLLAANVNNISRDAAISCQGNFNLGDGVKSYQFEVVMIGKQEKDQKRFPIYFFTNDVRQQVGFEAMLLKVNNNLIFQMNMDQSNIPGYSLIVQDTANISFSPGGTANYRHGVFVNFGKTYDLNCAIFAK